MGALAAATAAWIAWWVVGHRQWRCRATRMGIFYVGLLALLAALVSLAPWFGFAVFSAYFYVGDLPRRWQTPATLATAFLIGTSQAGGWPGRDGAAPAWAWAGLVTINLGLAGWMMWFALRNDENKLQRERDLAELTRVNAGLEASLAENAALHAELVERARQAGVVEERQRIAREIHDTLAQGLTGIVTQLEAAKRAPDWERRVDTAVALARQNLSDARRSVHAMRPEPLEGARLPDAIGQVAREWSAHGVLAQGTTTGEALAMRPDVEIVLLRSTRRWPTSPSTPARRASR